MKPLVPNRWPWPPPILGGAILVSVLTAFLCPPPALFPGAFAVGGLLAAFATDRLAIRREERHLAALFGAAWSAYVISVSRWFGRRMRS